jgi:prepilin-type N-terminal cleavage/methylation domain-containing protein
VGTFLFVGGQRGFTLVEMVVAVGIVAVLTVAATLSLALRPGALRATIASFDASFATARAIAATSGNGATMVVLPRTDGHGNHLPGFTLRIYRGRPTAANAVTLADAPALVADADVREATLGTPPFAIFLSSAGNASGLAAYPTTAPDGSPQFDPIAKQPPCPSGGLMLTFASSHASQTRVLPCGATAFGSPIPLATESPAPLVLTPNAIVFHWPTAPTQTFVATEWGYTRWFAADAFACGANIAQFPQSDPAPPYSPPHSPADESADPLAPAGVPFSFANAPDSMQEAPASFPLAPATAGLCTTTIADANGQKAVVTVQVMGQITASETSLTWASGDSTPKKFTLTKTWDAERLEPAVASSTCAGIATASIAGTPLVPPEPGTTATVRAVTITPVAAGGVNVGGSCAFTFASQYPGEPPAAVSINIAGGGGAISVIPAGVEYPVVGGQLTSMAPGRPHDAGAFVNALLGGGEALAFSPCPVNYARAFVDAAMSMPDANDPALGTDGGGCYDGHIEASEPGYAGAFRYANSGCATDLGNLSLSWSPLNASPLSAGGGVALQGTGEAPIASCIVTVTDASGQVAGHFGNVAVTVLQTQRWVADYSVTYQDSCDQQVGDCRESGPDTGTTPCSNPVAQPGGYEIGTFAISDVNSRGTNYLYNDASYTAQSVLAAGHTYSASSVDIHNDWNVIVEVFSCYDAGNPTQPVEIL